MLVTNEILGDKPQEFFNSFRAANSSIGSNFNMNTIFDSIKYKQHYLKEFKYLTDKELAEKFNSQVGIRYFNFAIQGFMNAMREDLERRELDYREIGNEMSISYANKIKILDGKITLKD